MERNAYPSPLNYYNFPKSVCTSVNESICHGIPDMRELKDGDIVNVDVTAYFGGFHGDLNEVRGWVVARAQGTALLVVLWWKALCARRAWFWLWYVLVHAAGPWCVAVSPFGVSERSEARFV